MALVKKWYKKGGIELKKGDICHLKVAFMQPYLFVLYRVGQNKRIFVIFWNPKIYFSEDNFMFLGVILCGESIAQIPEPWKCFPGPDSEKKLGFWKCEKRQFSLQKLKFSLNQGQESIFKVQDTRNRFSA